MIEKSSNEDCSALEGLAFYTERLLDELPRKRDWLDPDIENNLRGYLEEAQAEIAHAKRIREDYVSRADVATVLVALRDALTADGQAAKGDARLMMNGAVGRVQSAMSQLGVEY